MTDGSLKTLFHPFDMGVLDEPRTGERALVINAPADFRAPAGFDAALSLVQDLRPAFRALDAARFTVTPVAQGDAYDLALVFCGRHRGQNELWIADGLERVRPGGRIVVAGGRTEGAASLRKRIAALVEIEDHASKNHGVVFWLLAPASRAIDALRTANPAASIEGGFIASPGVFSHDRIDPGSAFLIQNLPQGLKGAAADFGAGWGYLSVMLARHAPTVASIDLYEASHIACEASKANIAALAPDTQATVHWCDLLAEKVERRYDLLVMNPPFHQGRAAEPTIGEGMIRAASAALKPGGRLFMVANRTLMYEPILQAGFARHGETARNDRFKVLWAVR